MSALTPTAEQQKILDAAAAGGNLAISAAAGSGKTSTLRMIATVRPRTRMLYVAYNRAIMLDARQAFPSNVTCKTAHSLAFAEFGRPMRRRLNGPRMTGRENARLLGLTTPFGFDEDHIFQTQTLALMAIGMVARFCRSADTEITTRHFVAPEGLNSSKAQALADYLLPFAERAWADLNAGEKGRLKATHDVYLKQWQLSHPDLTGWDVILYDEAQDADPCIASVVERQQHAQLIAVGDSAQAIYGWRGAGDFLSRVDAEHRLALTQSWRFGPAIAEEANVWLGVIGADLRVVGNPGRDSRLKPVDAPDAVLCRSNAGSIEQLLAAHDRGVKVQLVGDGKEMLALAQAAERFQDGKTSGHPDLVAFTSWQQVVDYAENDPGGSDLSIAVRMIERYGAHQVIRAIEGTVPAEQANLRVSTAHKAKGLEWDRVRIAADFGEPLDKRTGEPLPIPQAEAMLAYVAVTRARVVLDNGGLAWIHDHLAALAKPSAKTIDPTHIFAVPVPVPPPPSPPTFGRTVPQRAGPPAPEASVCSVEEQVDGAGLSVGATILVADERGTFVVRGVNKDGSLLVFRTDGAGGARNFLPEWCSPTTRVGKNGKRVKVRHVPVEAQAARAAWRARYALITEDAGHRHPHSRVMGL